MNFSNNESIKAFSIASIQGVDVSEVSLVGQNNNFLIKTQVKSLSSNNGVAILSDLRENRQRFLAIYRALDTKGAKLISKFRDPDVFPPIVTFDNLDEYILILSATGIEAFTLNDPNKAMEHKLLTSPPNEIVPPPPLLNNNNAEQVVIMDSLRINNNKVDANAFLILANFDRALTDS